MTIASDGWCDAPVENDFTRQFGPILRRRDGDRWVYAMRAETRHRNGAGVMHGGALTAFVDEVAGTLVAQENGKRHVTVQLACTFLRPVRIGELVEMDFAIVRTTRSMAFVEVKLRVAEEVAATASLIFKASGSGETPRS